jgi:hypothetical protein
MTKNTKTIIGVGAGVLLLLFLRKRKNSDVNTLRGVSADEGDAGLEEESTSGGGGGAIGGGGGGSLGGAIGGAISGIFGGGSGNGGGGIAPSPIVINNPTINTLRPMPVAQSSMSSRPYTSSVDSRPATSSVDSRPATSSVDSRPVATTSPNTTQAVSQGTMRSNFLTFDGSFRSPSNLDFDGGIID